MDNQDQYNPILYQRFQPNDKIKQYTIIGERHSGTNWLEKLINSQLKIPLTWEFGSKHFINPNPNELARADNCLFIVITRNIYDWIGAFYKLPHHVDMSIMKSMETFILSEWKNSGIDNDYFTQKPYKNIFKLRKYKLEYAYIILPLIVNNLIIIKYEDLLIDTKKIINFISDTFSIQKTNAKYTKRIKPRNKKTYKLQNNILSIINDETDWDVEGLFNYNKK